MIHVGQPAPHMLKVKAKWPFMRKRKEALPKEKKNKKT
jgi:hypothetical protein